MSTSTEAALSFLALLLIVLGVLAAAYLLLGLRIHIITLDSGNPRPGAVVVCRRTRAWLLDTIWYLGTGVSFVAFLILTVSLVGYFELLKGRDDFSTQYAHTSIDEQYSSVTVAPGLFFAASDELTAAGGNPRPGEAFTITAALKDYRRPASACTPQYLQQLARASTVQLRTSGFEVSGPNIDAEMFEQVKAAPKSGGKGESYAWCGVKWEWILSAPTGAGPNSAFAALAYRERASLTLYRVKPLHLAITPEPGPDVAASITSFAVALISLLAALIAAWFNRKPETRYRGASGGGDGE